MSLIDEQIEQAGWSKPQVDEAVSGKADVCRQSFKAYRQAIHPKLKWNWAVEEITDELQLFYEAFEEGRRPKLAIEMPPQHGKSLAAEVFISWVAGKRPEWKTIYASYTDRLGMRINRNLYRVFNTVSHHNIFPDFMIDQPGLVCNTELIEYVNGLGSFRNTTIEGSINGMELNLGVLDDYSKGRAEANSKLLRDKTWDWFTDDFMARFAQESAMLILCTRWHIDDVIGRYKAKFPSLREIKFSAIAEHDEEHRIKGEALFPAHKSLAFLQERKALMTEVSWQSEYQQQPYLSEGGMFPIDKFQTLAYFDRKEEGLATTPIRLRFQQRTALQVVGP